MRKYTITIPDALYHKAQQVAHRTSQPVDDVIRTRLEDALDSNSITLHDHEKNELSVLSYLSDDALWTIAREQFQPMLQARTILLMDKNSLGTLTTQEFSELSELVERGERLTLRKATAMKNLIGRGHKMILSQLKPTDE